MSAPLPKLHRISAAAAALGVSRNTVYRFAKMGKLTRVQIGENSSGITDESLRALMAVAGNDGGTATASDPDALQARCVDPFGVSKSKSSPTRRSRHPTRTNPEVDRIDYALSKHIVDMERGFTILTGYGALRIDADDAPRVVQVVRTVLKQQLKRAEVKHD
ncbi:helix-turn-helix domain-containing protein [Paraburkholderia sp. Ac-20342]|uniref:helix-turn-helix transcriptional regulator n=1 Tax=Paraburkholderia sp. Ac-20342 TaxID=2703889 RepID=UPI00197E529C|nr:helix-turn-helix domain-containing protein [Paraburkholderia sp. Ac-20342]